MKTKQQWIEDLNRLISLRGKKGAEFDRLHIKCAYAAVDVDETFHTLVMSGDFELAKSHIGKAKNEALEEAEAAQDTSRERMLDRAAVILAGFVAYTDFLDLQWDKGTAGTNSIERLSRKAIQAARELDNQAK